MDFLITDKKEGTIKTVYLDDELSSKNMYQNGCWIPICIKKGCTKFPEKNTYLCNYHLKDQKLIELGTICIKGSNTYVWTGKWCIKCSVNTCKNSSTKNGYCTKHDNLKNTGTFLGSTMDIFNMITMNTSDSDSD